MAYNRYINDESYHADTLLWDPILLDMLKMLREINAEMDSHIQCYGFDYEYLSLKNVRSTASSVIDFITGLNEWGHNATIDKLVVLLSEAENITDVLDFMEAQQLELNQVLWPDEIEIIKHVLTVSKMAGENGPDRYLHRDAVMAQNVSFLVNLLSPEQSLPVPIIGHLYHLGDIHGLPNLPSNSLGSLLHNEYKDDYSCIGLLVKGGMTQTMGGSVSIASVPENSVEFQMSLYGPRCFYTRSVSALDRLCTIRYSGSDPMYAALDNINLYQRVDGGFIFLESDSEEALEAAAMRQNDGNVNPDIMRENMLHAFIRRIRSIQAAKTRIAGESSLGSTD